MDSDLPIRMDDAPRALPLTSGADMVIAWRTSDDALRLARENPGLGVGVHLSDEEAAALQSPAVQRVVEACGLRLAHFGNAWQP